LSKFVIQSLTLIHILYDDFVSKSNTALLLSVVHVILKLASSIHQVAQVREKTNVQVLVQSLVQVNVQIVVPIDKFSSIVFPINTISDGSTDILFIVIGNCLSKNKSQSLTLTQTLYEDCASKSNTALLLRVVQLMLKLLLSTQPLAQVVANE
jgi:hypothetical protein